MKFARKDHAKMAVRILEDVKDTLPMDPDGMDSLYICDNIKKVSLKINSPLTTNIASQLRDWINDLLDDKFSLESWLRDNHNVVRPVTDKADYYNKLQVTRHAWLQWMIQEIKTTNKL